MALGSSHCPAGHFFKTPSLHGLVLKGEYPETREGVGEDLILVNMKKSLRVIFAFSFLNLIFCLNIVAKSADQNEQAAVCGRVMATMMLAINNLSNEDFCMMRNAIFDSSLTATEKYEVFSKSPGLIAFRNTCDHAGALFQANYTDGMFEEGKSTWISAKKACLNELGYDTIQWASIQNRDKCDQYQIQTDANIRMVALCFTSVSFGCMGSFLGYGACWLIGAGVCALQGDIQQNALNKSYPECVGSYKGILPWKSWIISEQTDSNYKCTVK
jgi:hypothetical protein